MPTTPTSSADTTGTSGRSRRSTGRSRTSRRPSPRIRTSPSPTPVWPWPTVRGRSSATSRPARGLAEQKAAALRALELDPGLGEARAALGAARTLEWDWEGAEAEFRSALEMDPNSTVGHLWYGWYLHARGRLDESLVHRRRALELDPLNIVVNRARRP